MLCKECGTINEEGKFCESCGAKLENEMVQESAEVNEETVVTGTSVKPQSEPLQPNVPIQTTDSSANSNVNEYVDKAKDVSKTYFSYFMRIIKSPLSESQNIRKEEFVNGVITISLYSLLIPLMMYLSLGASRAYLPSPFLNIFLKPTLGYAVFIFLITAFVFLAIQLGRVKVDIKDVIARFGALLVPFVALFLIGLVLALLQTGLFILALSLGFIGGIMAVPVIVIQSFKKNITGGLDALYGIILTYVLTGITLAIMSVVLLESLMKGLGDLLYMF